VQLGASTSAAPINHHLKPHLLIAEAGNNIDLDVSNVMPKQGETIRATVSQHRSASGMSEMLSPPIPLTNKRIFFNHKGFVLFNSLGASNADDAESIGPNYEALIAIPADLKPGSYSLMFGDKKKEITVVDAHFPIQHIHLPSGKDNFLASPGETEAVDKAKATVSPEQEWTNPFIAPSRARISAGFGLKRVSNGKLLTDYFHSGIDYAASLGSPVLATAPGKVILTGKGWRLHGNCVAIDHGHGVVSFYIHMQKLQVAIGDQVKAGQCIGRVGQTGRANGPHLHFSIYVNDTAANPIYWFRNHY
jgi:murein DD-endopeptidase MepM/ murein hydrolase activator NlpD